MLNRTVIFNVIRVKTFNSPKFQEHYLSDGKPKIIKISNKNI